MHFLSFKQFPFIDLNGFNQKKMKASKALKWIFWNLHLKFELNAAFAFFAYFFVAKFCKFDCDSKRSSIVVVTSKNATIL